MHSFFRTGLSCLLTALAVNAQAFVRLDSGPRFRYIGEVSAVSTGACDIVVEIVAARMEGPNAIVQRSKGRLYLPKADEVVDRDAAGRLTVDSRWEYTWNLRGELLIAESKHRSPNVQLTYSYYPSGPMARREKREWVNDDWALVSTTRWIVDGWRPVKEIEARVGGDTIERVYTWGLDLAGWQDRRSLGESGGIGGLLAVREKVNGGSETTYYVLGDPMGNVMALATSGGALVAEYDYDPYGRLIRETGASAATCPFRYSTKYRDPDLELYYYGHRWYDAAALKWLTPDPIGERGGVNLTAFCNGDPINKVDPLGLKNTNVIELNLPGISSPAYQFAGDWTNPSSFRALQLSGFAVVDKVTKPLQYSMLAGVAVAAVVYGGPPAWTAVSDLSLKAFVVASTSKAVGYSLTALAGYNLCMFATSPEYREATISMGPEIACASLYYSASDVYQAARVGTRTLVAATATTAARTYLVGEVMPNGNLAGVGPGAALRNSPDFIHFKAVTPKGSPVQLELNFGQSLPWQRGESGLVIGRGADLMKPGSLGPGEFKFGWFSVQKISGMEAEWAVNQSKLKNVMDLRKSIRDASPIDDFCGFYLNRERYTQQFLGWRYESGRWLPPSQ
ncbi:MAG: RHS repeat-associated core domain-containing protein [Kiritimatiellia bacterium]|nr:RHS repeat-associated core domain-containing protein [Kiritimatiellia bacterium]